MEHIDIVAQIRNKLDEIEYKENVKIIMAVESGSRAWGFASPDSDYDVRFIYVRKLPEYLSLYPARDVIEWQLDEVYDVSGWDLQKALRLMYDSNPALQEWCSSPIIYRESELADPLRELAKECFLPKRALYHYYSMAYSNTKKYLSSDEVRLKKYFYVLRPLLAARWVVDHGTAAPMLFDDLVKAELPEVLRPAVEELIDIKKNTPEIGNGARIPELDSFINEQLESIKEWADKAETRYNDKAKLEEFFRSVVL